jgi:peptide/nickel transport system permease protein
LGQYLLVRLAQIPITLGIILGISFFLIHAAPGDPVAALAGDYVTREYRDLIIRHYGLDQPLLVQAFKYFANITTGDFGASYYFKAPVFTVISSRIFPTLLLILPAVLLSTGIGIGLGYLTARHKGALVRIGIPLTATVVYALPTFWLGYLLILCFSIKLNLLPIQGMSNPRYSPEGWAYLLDVLKHLALPLLTMVLTQLAQVILLIRTRLLEEMRLPYFKTALAKGLKQNKAILHHALPNALMPVVTVLGTRFGFLITGSILTETVFAWPGLGRLMIKAIEVRDYPLVLGILFMLSIIVMLLNLLTDLVYTLLDPRIHFGRYGD